MLRIVQVAGLSLRQFQWHRLQYSVHLLYIHQVRVLTCEYNNLVSQVSKEGFVWLEMRHAIRC